MNLNKCERCGCFFTAKVNVCPNCMSKDQNEIAQIKNFLIESEEKVTLSDLTYKTGISERNLNRFLQDSKVNSSFKDLGLITNSSKKINL